MSYTVGSIAGKARLRVRDTGYAPDSTLNFLNDTQNDIFNEYRLPFMEATQNYTFTVGDSDITHGAGLPFNYAQAIDLFCTTAGQERVIPYRDIREIDSFTPDPDDTVAHPPGTPQAWYLYALTPRVRPVPDLAYTATLRYYKKPTLLVNDGDVPEVPSEFEEILVVGTAYRILQAKDQYDQAAILQNKYDELLQKLVMRFNQPQVGTPAIMRINYRGLGKTHF